MMKHRLLLLCLLVLCIIGISIASLLLMRRHKNQKYTLKFPDDYSDDNMYSIRQLYSSTFLFDSLPDIATGRGQSIAIIADVLSVWYLQDVMNALHFNNIHNKSAADIFSQISYVNASIIQDEPFSYGNYDNLTIPLSNGVVSKVPFEAVPQGPSKELSNALQTIFCLLPDVQIIIYYIGAVCPPVVNINMETVVEYLISALWQTGMSYNILCFTMIFNVPGFAGRFYDLFTQLKINYGVTTVTTVGTALDTNLSYPAGFSNVVNVGGFAWTDDDQRKPVAYMGSHGGYFTSSPYTYINSTIPYYQIGTVPSDRGTFIGAQQYKGCPDISGNIKNLATFFNSQPQPERYEDMATSALAYACLFAMINQASNNNKWNYVDILYRYSELLFEPVTTGQNDRYSVQDYRPPWNPCTGLGILHAPSLAALLSAKYLLTGSAIQISSTTITEKMSYLNFFPCSPLQDPLNFQPEHDYYNSLPSFGPQSIWSFFLIFKVDPATGMLNTAVNQPVYHGDTVVVLYPTRLFIETEASDMYYLLECFNGDTVRTHTFYNSDLIGGPIDPRYRWVIVTTQDMGAAPIKLFDRCRLLPSEYQEYGVCLTSHYSTNGSIFASSPSLMSRPPDGSDLVHFCPHPYPYLPLPHHAPEKSYFVNFTNYTDYWSCDADAFQPTSVISKRKSASMTNTLPFVQFVGKFDHIPQWLLIPLSVKENNSLSLQYGEYAIYNTRTRAFVYNQPGAMDGDGRLRMININSQTAPVNKDVLPYCRFRFSPINAYTSTQLFESRPPMNELENNLNINPFLCPLQIFFDSPYFKNNSPSAYTLYVDDTEVTQDGVNYVKLSGLCPDASTPTTFCFHIDPSHLISQYTDVTMITPRVNITRNNIPRFIDHAVSSETSNSYVRMVPYYDQAWTRNISWKVVALDTTAVADTDDPYQFVFPVLDFNNNTKTTLENIAFPSQFLIHSEGGWKPRLGFAVSEIDPGLNWNFRPNYLNQKPSETQHVLRLTGNYFYHSTLYYISTPDGAVMSCSVDAPHLPALLNEFNNQNMDSLLYASMFLVGLTT